MTKLLELIMNENIEWKSLRDICEIERGVRVTKNDLISNGSYPVVSGGTGYMGYFDKYNRNKDTITIAQYGTAGYVNWQTEKFWANDVCFSVYPNEDIDNRYLYHFLKDKQEYLYKISNRNAVPYSISRDKILDITVPVPSLEVQKIISKTLDKFTKYVTELQAELQARNKQYSYYLDLLLSKDYLEDLSVKAEFIDNEKSLTKNKLSEITDIVRGKRLVRSQLDEENGYPVFQNSMTPLGFYSEINFTGDKAFVIAAGAAGEIGYSKNDFWAADDVYVCIPRDKVLSKYLYYFLMNQQTRIKSQVRRASIPRLPKEVIEKLEIIIPSIKIQSAIIEILDKFEKLTNETKGLLPEEVELREKQYSYYREKLLTFDKNVVNTHTHTHTHTIAREFFDLLLDARKTVGITSNTAIREVMLGEIGEFINGSGMPKTMFDENGEVGAIHYGHIYTSYNYFVRKPIVKVSNKNAEKLKKIEYGDLVIARTSENVEDIMKSVAYLGNDIAVVGGHSAIFKHKQDPKFMSYLINGSKDVIKQKNRLTNGVKVMELSTTSMQKIKVTIPSIGVQRYVVSVLDNFYSLVNDISNGLPKEIELRQKQYEYYREKLLSFKK